MKEIKNFMINANSQKFVIINAEQQSLGKLAVLIANFITQLAKNNKNIYRIYISNFSKIRITGSYLSKKYYKSTSRVGSLKNNSFLKLLEKNPAVILQTAIKKMIKKTTIKKDFLKQIQFLKEVEFA